MGSMRTITRQRDSGPDSSLVVLWQDWCWAAAEATLALGEWRVALGRRRSTTFVAYRAALDQEEAAAAALQQRATCRTSRLLGSR
jgi:hypothetical protein